MLPAFYRPINIIAIRGVGAMPTSSLKGDFFLNAVMKTPTA